MSDGLLLTSDELNIAEQAITADVLIRHTTVLASNEFQGMKSALHHLVLHLVFLNN
jgi:hypothetical protein